MSAESNGPLPPLAEGAWRVIYFDAPNRGEQLRLLFALTRTPFEDYRLPFPEGKKPLIAAGDANPLAFDLTPIVQHGSISIGIVPGAMLYTAEKLGIIPENPLARALAVSIVDASEMMRNDVFYKVFFNRAKIRKELETLNKEPYLTWLGRFERLLRRKVAGSEPLTAGVKPGPFFLGSDICYADVAVYDCLCGIWAMDVFDQEGERRACAPLLCALVDAVASQPGIAEYEVKRGSQLDIYARAEAKAEAARKRKSNL